VSAKLMDFGRPTHVTCRSFGSRISRPLTVSAALVGGGSRIGPGSCERDEGIAVVWLQQVGCSGLAEKG
jgi:hypothetical protein